jgi:hypothetical protein
VVLSDYTWSGDEATYSSFGAETQLTWWGEWYVYVQQMAVPSTLPHDKPRLRHQLPEGIAATEFFRNKSMGDPGVKFAPDSLENVWRILLLGRQRGP